MTEETKEKQVTITEKDYKSLLDTIKGLKDSQDMLLQVADKRQLAIYYQRHQKELPKIVKLRTMVVKEQVEGIEKITEKVIVGWQTTQDEVFQDPVTMRWTERQKVKMLFEDGTSQEYWLMDYVRLYKHVEAKIVSKTTDEVTGDITLKVQRLDNGKEYQIGILFIN